jgi:hypothetical protein
LPLTEIIIGNLMPLELLEGWELDLIDSHQPAFA